MKDRDTFILESLYASIIEEAKDYRRLIVKQQGMPEDVAEYLHSFNLEKNSDNFSQWFAIQIKKMEGYKQAEDKIVFVQSLISQLESILDWFNSEKNIPIFDYSWDEALAKDYRKMLLKGGADKDIIEYLHSISPQNYFIYINQLKKFKAFKEATDKMAWFESVFIKDVPVNVRTYLLNIATKNYLWFVIQIKKMEGYMESSDKMSWINNNIGEDITNITDWLRNSPNENIWACIDGEVEREGRALKVSGFDRARGRANQYHLNLAATGGTSTFLEGPEKRKIIKEYEDGYYWITHEALSSQEESRLMGHCGSDSIYDPATNKSAPDGTIISLRYLNPKNNHITAHVTATVSSQLGAWIQCKGRGNSRPNKNYYPYIADIMNELKIYRFIYGSYKPELNFDDTNYLQTIMKYPEMFPNMEEIIPKVRASLKARNLKQLFSSMSSEFNQNVERQFIEFDDDDKRAYIEGGYVIGTKKAVDSLTPELKDLYFSKIIQSSDRSLQYIESQLKSGVALKDIDARFIASVKRDKYAFDQFISSLIKNSPDFEQNPEIMDLIANSPDKSSEYVIKLLQDKKKTISQIEPKFMDSIGNRESTVESFIEKLLDLKIDFENDPKILDLISKSSRLSLKYVTDLIVNKKIKPINIEDKYITSISKNTNLADNLINSIFGANINFGLLPPNFLKLLNPMSAYKYITYLLDVQKKLINQINSDLIIQIDKSSGKTYHLIDHIIELGQEKLLYNYKAVPESIRKLIPAVFGHAIENETDARKKQNLQTRMANLEKTTVKSKPVTRRGATPTPTPEPEPEDEDEGFDINF